VAKILAAGTRQARAISVGNNIYNSFAGQVANYKCGTECETRTGSQSGDTEKSGDKIGDVSGDGCWDKCGNQKKIRVEIRVVIRVKIRVGIRDQDQRPPCKPVFWPARSGVAKLDFPAKLPDFSAKHRNFPQAVDLSQTC
jgi:hypothetical protein